MPYHQTMLSKLLKHMSAFGMLVAFLFTSRFAWARSDSVPAATIQNIGVSLRAGQYKAALQLIEVTLRDSPNDPRLRSMQGMALSGLHRTSDALVAYQRALKSAPDYLPALEGAAQIEYEAGGENAIPLLQQILKTHPNDSTSHAMLGALDYKRQDCRGAVLHFERSRKVIDSQPSALQQYGSCLAKVDRVDEAIAIFQKVADSNPGDTQARIRLAALQLKAKRPQTAIATLLPLLAQNQAQQAPPDASVSELASAAYEASGNTQEAVNLLNRAVTLYPRDLGLYLDLAELAFDHHSFKSGVEVMSAGLRVLPDAAPLYLERGLLYVQLADYEKAEADFEKAAKLDPRQTVSQVAQGKISEQNGNFEQALEKVQQRLAKTPNDALLLYTRAEILAQKGVEPGSRDFQLALESARKAVALQPRMLLARNIVCTLLLSAGKLPEAADQARQILKEDPDNESALYHLIIALRRQGKTAELPDLLKRLRLRQAAVKDAWTRSRGDQAGGTPR